MAQLGDTLTTRDAVRSAVCDDIIGRCQAAAVAIEGGPLDGIEVVSMGTLRDQVTAHLLVELPPPSAKHAEVTTPASITVSAICPECGLPTEIVVKLAPQLTVTNDGAELAVKAKTKARVHLCGQLSLPVDTEQETLDGAIDALRLRILRAVADVSDAWGDKGLPGPGGPPPTLEAIASFLELAADGDRGDLEESLYAYAQADPALVEIVSAKGQPVHYVLTDAGIELVAAGDAEDDDEADE